jgi:FkbH-like protein
MQSTAVPLDGGNLFRVVRGMEKQGRIHEALALLRESLRRNTLDTEGIQRAGRTIHNAWLAGASDGPPLRVLLLGQFTTTWLVHSLTGVAWGHGTAVLADEGGYDTIIQDLYVRQAGVETIDIIVLLPWSQRLLTETGNSSARVESELEFWRRVWEQTGRMGVRVLQVGYDWVTPGPWGYSMASRFDGPIALINAMNRALHENLPSGAFFLDLGLLSGTVGRSSFYDMRRYHWTKQPFGERGLRLLAEHIWAGVRAMTVGPKKVLVLDLDNTLWGGVVGETGPLAVALGDSPDGEAFRSFQRHLKGLAKRGVVLAIASKNNLADALEVFEKNSDMLLRLDDFGAYEINWEPKGTTIARLAQTLNLGLDSFVFFDDNPAEREQVRQALPEVEIVEVPDDPAEYTRALQEGLYFETVGLTEEDHQRTGQYVTERKRRQLESSAASLDDYLSSLEMCGHIRPIDDADLARVVQLLSKTNQFNLTTRRHSRDALLDLLALSGSIGLTLRLADRFGDHGLVAVVIVVPAGETATVEARIDTWLMSCRVIGRTAEQFFFTAMLERCRTLGYRRLIGEYIPTKKNGLVADFYQQLGFNRLNSDERSGPSSFFALDLQKAVPPLSFIRQHPVLDGEVCPVGLGKPGG